MSAMPTVSRRQFLAATAAASGGAAALPKAFAPGLLQAPPASLDPWLEIHAANLAHNVRQVGLRAGGQWVGPFEL
jgi:hypothetical protein